MNRRPTQCLRRLLSKPPPLTVRTLMLLLQSLCRKIPRPFGATPSDRLRLESPRNPLPHAMHLPASARCRSRWAFALDFLRAPPDFVEGFRDLRAVCSVVGFEEEFLLRRAAFDSPGLTTTSASLGTVSIRRPNRTSEARLPEMRTRPIWPTTSVHSFSASGEIRTRRGLGIGTEFGRG